MIKQILCLGSSCFALFWNIILTKVNFSSIRLLQSQKGLVLVSPAAYSCSAEGVFKCWIELGGCLKKERNGASVFLMRFMYLICCSTH
jgi:hypothetical protein